MIYVDNDFYANFINAVKSDDDKMIRKMIIDQLSTCIAKKRKEVLQVLNKTGLSLSKNPSNEEIVNKIVSNIRNNKKLQAGLAYVIAHHNDILGVSEEKVKKAEKEQEKNGKKTVGNDEVGVVTQISKTLYLLAESLEGERADEFKADLERQTNNKAPNFSGKAYGEKTEDSKPKTKKKKSRKKLYIFLGVVAVAGIAYYGYKKGWFNKLKKAEGGGEMGGSDSLNTAGAENIAEGVSQ